MTTTRQQLLGWIEHCEREHPGKATNIPVWLCSMDALHEAEIDGFVSAIGKQPFIARDGSSLVIYGLTDKGRQEFYGNLPRAGAET